MSLEIYKRRHSPECLAELERAGKSAGLSAKDLQQHDACDCAWWVRGTTDYGRSILPRSIKVRTRALAQAEADRLNLRPGSKESASTLPAITMEQAYKKWEQENDARGVDHSSIKVYESAFNRFRQVPTIKRLVFLSEVMPEHINQVRLDWKGTMARNTFMVYFQNVRSFFKFCVRMDYLHQNPCDKVAPLKRKTKQKLQMKDAKVVLMSNSNDETATLPLDPEGGEANYRKILSMVAPYFTRTLHLIDKRHDDSRRRKQGVFFKHPENFVFFLQLMYETGLRISDAVLFNLKEVEIDRETGIGVYTTDQYKTGFPVTAFLEPWLLEGLRKLPYLDSEKRYLFFSAQTTSLDAFINPNIRGHLAAIGTAAGVEGVRPHRFRDSFAVNRLNEGMSMEDVSTLLGHQSIAMTERYYAPYVKSRKKALLGRLRSTRAAAEKLPATGTENVVQMPAR